MARVASGSCRELVAFRCLNRVFSICRSRGGRVANDQLPNSLGRALCHSGFFLFDDERYVMSDAELDVLRTIVTTVAERELLPRFTAMARAQKQDGSVLNEEDIAVQDAFVL